MMFSLTPQTVAQLCDTLKENAKVHAWHRTPKNQIVLFLWFVDIVSISPHVVITEETSVTL